MVKINIYKQLSINNIFNGFRFPEKSANVFNCQLLPSNGLKKNIYFFFSVTAMQLNNKNILERENILT